MFWDVSKRLVNDVNVFTEKNKTSNNLFEMRTTRYIIPCPKLEGNFKLRQYISDSAHLHVPCKTSVA